MAGQQKKSKDAKGSKAGRNRFKAERYQSWDHQTEVMERKLRRMLKSNGAAAARDHAQLCGAEDVLRRIAAHRDGGRISELAAQALKASKPEPVDQQQ